MKKISDYSGYEWGWIKADGKREEAGTVTVIKVVEIAGVWGRLFRKGYARPYYRETFLSEIPDNEDVPLAKLQNVNLQQCMAFAYPESKPVANIAISFQAEAEIPTEVFQEWACVCGHTFYTAVGIKRTVTQLLKGQYASHKCEVCSKAAKRSKKVRKEI